MIEDELRSSGVPDNYGNLDQDLNFLVLPILNFNSNDIITVFPESARNGSSLIVKLHLIRNVDGFKRIRPLAIRNIDFDIELIVFIVSEEVLLFGFEFAGSLLSFGTCVIIR